MKFVSDKLQLASEVDVSELASDPAVQQELYRMHAMAIRVCKDCRMKRRRDGALIYIPKERAHLADRARDKNLVTLWPNRRPLGLRVMFPKNPTPGEEKFDAALRGL